MLGFIALAAGAGAALAYFLDPQNGKRRRHMAVDRTAGMLRRGGTKAGRAGRTVAAEAYGVKQKALHLRERDKPQPDDVTLARKVESEIFRDGDVPKGRISVNAEEGVVYLRGELENSSLIEDLEQAARRVQGVRGVRNLLHTPGTPAPSKET